MANRRSIKKTAQDRGKKKFIEEPVPAFDESYTKPQAPNIFLYIQLANISSLPTTIHPLEIHLEQGGSLIVKCSEQYNTDGYILQNEFDSKPTFTLIFQQDNIDRINHAVDNPLLIMLYMRKLEVPPMSVEEENLMDEGESEERPASTTEAEVQIQKEPVRPSVQYEESGKHEEDDDVDYYLENETMLLLCAGYLDLIKLFSHRRCMTREDLFLYPFPDVPNELRRTVKTEWHLYTLLPIAKELKFTEMAFITFESIYNLKDNYVIDTNTMEIDLSFRSTRPNERNEYEEIPLCTFKHLVNTTISKQHIHHVFESFRSKSLNLQECNAPGLKSVMEVELHRLFLDLMRSEGLQVDFEYIDVVYDDVIVCNSFHRYALTHEMSSILVQAIAFQQFVVAIDIWQAGETRQKLFRGVLDPAILVYPNVTTMRFAVELEYVGPKGKPKSRRQTLTSLASQRISSSRNKQNHPAPRLPTFAIVKICLFAPLGEISKELVRLGDSCVSHNRLGICDHLPSDVHIVKYAEIEREAYRMFDKFMQETITYIVENDVHSVEERREYFCCILNNFANILLKVVGSDFNVRVPTKTNVDFANLCSIAYNELELRVHNIVAKVEEDGFEDVSSDEHAQMDTLIDHMNAIKILYSVRAGRMEKFLYEQIKRECHDPDLLDFYLLISNMERGDYEAAKAYFISPKKVSEVHDYFAGWIKLYITYVDTRSNPVTAVNATECLLNSITNYSEEHSAQMDGWILLYCYYKQFKYVPGSAYARWRYEDQYNQLRSSISSAPYSLWGIVLNLYPKFNDDRGYIFYDVFKVFVRLGLYEFAKVIFSTVENLCNESDRYLINTTLNTLLNQLDPKFTVRQFSFDSSDHGKKMSAFLSQANGNLEYHRGNMSKAANYYQRNLELPVAENERDRFLLSALRLAYISYDNGDYETAIKAFSKQVCGRLVPLVCNYMIGKSYYKLQKYEKAIEYFARCTRHNTHVPDIWAHLALVNIHLGDNYAALECWKYAKIDPTKFIDDEIILELDKIDFDDVDLFIDLPANKC
ncbi:uncharacterized protein LOC115623659 [Scaptodrosophila lebanonensis]|uniref:Uncharacterized protein LOC115623659 n=1 Tax=Drosophila lebanonensis TaxID=7225 RepID=A0A6J2TG43_DROLE|nr:uncharacterized protein LOC115623659 [Scaptodrosophila lebanonensis]